MTTERKALKELMWAISEYAYQHGQAEWLNGYRTGKKDESDELFKKQMDRHTLADHRMKELALAIRYYKQAVASGRAPKVARNTAAPSQRRKA